MKKPAYFDYMATTPVDPAVVEAMTGCLSLEGVFGNPASVSHVYGWEAGERVKKAREQVADLIQADPREIVWTSGATESNNLAIKGVSDFYRRQGKHIITMATEHKAVLDPCHFLETQGFEVTYLKPERDGLLDLDRLKAAVRPDTVLISVMHVNNETGVIQDIAAIGELAFSVGVKFHVDAAQSVGKLPINLRVLHVDLMSFSAHKLYGPKGVGALYVRRTPRVRLTPLQHGGAHERGLRAGTLPTHQIVGMGEACALAKGRLESEYQRLSVLRNIFWEGIVAIGGVSLNGHPKHCFPGCLNIYFEGLDGESLMTALSQIALSSGSACNSATSNPSHVLLAMGLSRQEAFASLRLSLGRFTDQASVSRAVEHIHDQVRRLRKLSPLWDTVKNGVRKKL